MTLLSNIIKIALVILVFYIIYKTGIINKVYILVNKYLGITEKKKREDKKRQKYINRLLKNMNKSEEI